MNTSLAAAHEALWERGYIVRPFTHPGPMAAIQDVCRQVLRDEKLEGDLPDYHLRVPNLQVHLPTVAKLTEALNSTNLVEQLFRTEEPFLQSLLGPDLVIQSAPHLRVHRPGEERDGIDLHRDSFYGSSIWHLNCWFPLVPLGAASGLILAGGTHRQPSRNVRDKSFPDEFRSSVTKGSLENRLGYVYRRRTDDVLESLSADQLVLVAPPWQSYVLFFACMVHGGTNRSATTRWSVDVRFSRPDDGSAVKPGFFREFTRGLIRKVATEFYQDAGEAPT